jgi:SAM-dependent methyltransferase
MDPAEVVRRGYDAIGEAYHEWSHDDPDRIAYVGRLRDRLPAGSLVLDLGCGPGDPATRMLAERHRVVAVDLSYTQLTIARRHAPSAALAQADATRLAVRDGTVDAVAAFFVLGHLPPAEHAPLLARIAHWLKPGGVLVTTVPLTPGEGGDDDWLGVPMYFGGIGREATLAALAAAGLDVESVERLGPEGERFDWVVATRGAGAAAR